MTNQSRNSRTSKYRDCGYFGSHANKAFWDTFVLTSHLQPILLGQLC